jgi:hypothetical protein
VGPQLANKNRLIILRLWPSNLEILPANTPVWAGNISYLHVEKDLPLITYLRTGKDFETPLALLRKALTDSEHIRLARRNRPVADERIRWQGNVLLSWEAGL